MAESDVNFVLYGGRVDSFALYGGRYAPVALRGGEFAFLNLCGGNARAVSEIEESFSYTDENLCLFAL